MQPPRQTRRPGFSRRRQLGLFAGQVAAIAGVLAGLALLVVARVDRAGFSTLRGAALDLTAPIATPFRAVVRQAGAMADGLGDYLAAGSQNRALRAALAADRAALIEARAQAIEVARLKASLRVIEPASPPIAVARLVASTAAGPRREATLTAGSLAGVRSGQPVRAAEGLIGRVVEVGVTAARVMLVTDEGNIVPVRLARDGTPALVSGTGEAIVEVKALSTGPAPFRRGDLLVTSGTGGLYPPDVPVAVITRADRDGAIAYPLADPSRAAFAIVEPVFQTDLSASPAAKPAR